MKCQAARLAKHDTNFPYKRLQQVFRLLKGCRWSGSTELVHNWQTIYLRQINTLELVVFVSMETILGTVAPHWCVWAPNLP